MEMIRLNRAEFEEVFTNSYFQYAGADFNILNSEKVDEVFFFGFKEKKFRLGIIFGEINHNLLSPFSSPFGGFIFIKDDVRINYLDAALQELDNYAKKEGIKGICITLPPGIYNESFISNQVNTFFRNNYSVNHIELNHYFELKKLNDNYVKHIRYNARKNLKIALKGELSFRYCEDIGEKELAYDIIKHNRNAKGFPLKMSWAQVQDTIKVIQADFFLVFYHAIPVASAILFKVTNRIYQVIYWGDNPEYGSSKPMNYLSFKVFEYYKNHDVEIIDIGPSSENSIPNLGLADFKESIGCDVTMKFSVKKTFNAR